MANPKRGGTADLGGMAQAGDCDRQARRALHVRHIARFILVGLYTGTRAGAVCGATLIPTIGRGHINLETGQFRRLAYGKKESNKRQPTIDLPPFRPGALVPKHSLRSRDRLRRSLPDVTA